MRYRCNSCGEMFEEPIKQDASCYEEYNGDVGLNEIYDYLCPTCMEENITEDLFADKNDVVKQINEMLENILKSKFQGFTEDELIRRFEKDVIEKLDFN